ncbi:MAG TPA: VacJ family lipoprotein [Steroidobacteraceae bacterium]|jgi:phospholipid-binding lipoprotein MlaA|nr:VacJ family lipoprotein [Steroidobacteraceae bacterium]HJY36219.1 VacJ family lipoprotein [Steroidobacteraceae bacterium]
MPSPLRAAVAVLIALLGAGCAATPGRTTPDDRWEGFNRGVYKFNDAVDRAALKPVAKGYRKITPHWMRVGIGNFLANLEYPATVVNQFLQGKFKLGLRDTGRFLINTTVGIGGLLDPATSAGLEANDEDLGQTLAVWGVGSGPYLNLPLFGPSTLRDAPTRMVDFFFDPITYIEVPWEAIWGERVLNVVHNRAELLPLESTLEKTYDPYAFIRDSWVQRREYAIFDGNPPPEQLEDFEEEPTDGDAPAPDQPPEAPKQ